MPETLRPWRSLAIGALAVAFLCALTPYNDYHLKNTYLYGSHLPVGGLCIFALLAMAVNPLLRRYLPRGALKSGELLLIWVMMTCGAGLASSGLWRYLGPIVVAPAYFASSGRPWLQGLDHTPSWLLLTRDPKSPLALWFYYGIPPGRQLPWAAWTDVVIAWGLVFACMAAFSIGVTAIFRRQWIQHERLAYPLARLPVQIVTGVEEGKPLGRDRRFWIGCVTVFVVHLVSTLHAYKPSVPGAPDVIDITTFQLAPPWNGLGLPTIEIYYAVIGVIYLLPTDVALSLWSVYICLHLFRVVRVAWGYDPNVIGPLGQDGAIGAGAFLYWTAWMCWVSRRHLSAVWRRAIRGHPSEDPNEPLSPRAALLLTLAGACGMVAWMCAAGVTLPIAALIVGLMCVIMLVLSRIMAEAGLMFLQTPFIPTDLMAFWGTRYFSMPSAPVSLLTEVVLIHDPREHIAPSITNGFYLAGQSTMRPKVFTWGIAAALVIGFIVSFYSFVGVSYHYGAITLDPYGTNSAPHWSLDRAMDYVRSPLSANRSDLQALAAGLALAAAFTTLKSRYLWWPIGPIGLAMSSTYAMDRIWFSVFIGWACRASALRLAGLRGYRLGLPYFLGLIVGEGLFGGFAIMLATILHAPTPQFLPG